jgi:hypothetical protein
MQLHSCTQSTRANNFLNNAEEVKAMAKRLTSRKSQLKKNEDKNTT